MLMYKINARINLVLVDCSIRVYLHNYIDIYQNADIMLDAFNYIPIAIVVKICHVPSLLINNEL